MLTPPENLEDELVTFFTILTQQGFNVFERRSFERLETVFLVHLTHDIDDVFATSNVRREEITRAARWFCGRHPVLTRECLPRRMAGLERPTLHLKMSPGPPALPGRRTLPAHVVQAIAHIAVREV